MKNLENTRLGNLVEEYHGEDFSVRELSSWRQNDWQGEKLFVELLISGLGISWKEIWWIGNSCVADWQKEF